MRDKTRALEVQGAKVGLKINAIKTKLMRIGTKGSDVCRSQGGGLRKWMSFMGALQARREELTNPGLEISTRKLAKCEWFFEVASLKNIL